MANEPQRGASRPPPRYRLDQVRLRVTHQPGSASSAVRRLTISGTGSATLDRDGRSVPFHYPPKDLVALLNDLYRIRFFDMPADYSTRHSVVLLEDGSLAMSALKMVDEAHTTVCLTLGAYEKCVQFAAGARRELDEFVERAEREAGR